MNGDVFLRTFAQMTTFLSAFFLANLLSITGSVAQAQETDLNIVADQVRSQGFRCNAISVEQVAAESSPGSNVYVLKCDGVTYRVRIIPDEASQITELK
jgi:hypothetical protein